MGEGEIQLRQPRVSGVDEWDNVGPACLQTSESQRWAGTSIPSFRKGVKIETDKHKEGRAGEVRL